VIACIVTHFHEDRTAGLNLMRSKASKLTAPLSQRNFVKNIRIHKHSIPLIKTLLLISGA
jgi:hypothetical protein